MFPPPVDGQLKSRLTIPTRTGLLRAARVGGGAGLDLRLVDDVRAAVPGLTLAVGGGVRGVEDLTRLADAGCDAALVATALHDGRLGAAEIASSAGLQACRTRRT